MEISKSTDSTISVVMISYNDEKILEDCLSSIRKQSYPQELIDIIIVDGGSTDNTPCIAKKYNARFFRRPDLKDHPNTRGGIALTKSKSDFVLFFSADNRLDEISYLFLMVSELKKCDAFAAESLRYGYHRSHPILTRYFALIGGTDPVAIFLGKADRKPYDQDCWKGYGNASDNGNFYTVKFENNPLKIPTLGANGFLFKRCVMENSKYAKSAFHIDMCVETILKGYDNVLFFKNLHTTHFINLSIFDFIKRRVMYANIYQGKKGERIYKIINKNDYFKLAIYVLYSITIIGPFLRSLKGYLALRDYAWFLHSIACLIFTLGYGRMVILNFIQKYINLK